ncbi:MAG: transposase [Nitrospirae bacterium]|nr:transposase [Nitrospirota bacterium]
MARPLRIQYPGAIYHVTCRGNERKKIFHDDQDRKKFLKILAQSSKIYNILIYSYVLMDNHFHLLLETPLANLGEFMRQFNITYTGNYNRRHDRTGHLYQGRYKSILVDKASYLSMVSRYIHLNPIRAKVGDKRPSKGRLQYLLEYTWSSLRGYINKRHKETIIAYGIVLEEYGGDKDRGRDNYKKAIYADMMKGIEIKDKIIGQSILGGEGFIDMVRDKFVRGKKDRECPSVREIQRYRSKEEILKYVKRETLKGIEEIRADKGDLRGMVMDLLYRTGGLNGREIGEIFGVDYSTVSQERRRLREKIVKDGMLAGLLGRLERGISKIKN